MKSQITARGILSQVSYGWSFLYFENILYYRITTACTALIPIQLKNIIWFDVNVKNSYLHDEAKSPLKTHTLFVCLTNGETAIYIATKFLSDHHSNGYQHYCYVMIDNTAKIDSVNYLTMVAYLNVIHAFLSARLIKSTFVLP